MALLVACGSTGGGGSADAPGAETPAPDAATPAPDAPVSEPADETAGPADGNAEGHDAPGPELDAIGDDGPEPDADVPIPEVPDATDPSANSCDGSQAEPESLAEATPDVPSVPDTIPELDAAAETDPGPVYGPAGTPFPIEGFGAGTLGGWQEGHDTYVVTSLADDGAGTLREGLRTGNAPRLVLFEVDGAIPLQAALIVPSNVTIDGRGHAIVLQGKGLVLPGSDHVIVTNLALEDVGPESEDGVQIGSALPDPSEYVVLDHVRFTQHGDNGNCENVDEAVSVIYGSRYLTFAWLRFESWEKVLLAGNGDADPVLDAQITLTWHHSYAVDTGRRHPQARYGRFHLVNDVFDDWHMYGWEILPPYHESFGAQVQDNGRMLLEGLMVRRLVHDDDWTSLGGTVNDASRCEAGGDLKETGTWVDPASTAALRFGTGCALAEAFTPPYVLVAEPAGPALRDQVVAGAGNTL